MTPEKRAAEVWSKWGGILLTESLDDKMIVHIAAAIRDAVAAERERCAKIAEQTHMELDAELSPEGCTDTGLEIARRIREATP